MTELRKGARVKLNGRALKRPLPNRFGVPAGIKLEGAQGTVSDPQPFQHIKAPYVRWDIGTEEGASPEIMVKPEHLLIISNGPFTVSARTLEDFEKS